MISLENKKLLLLIFVAFAFSFALRLVWVYQFHDYEPFDYNSELMINTNDGYYFAEGARDIISGESQENDLSPLGEALSIVTAMIAKVLPFSFETIIFYMPAFFSSLIVIPLILIGKSLKLTDVGFIAALFASIAHSYYNRTMIGYYDTDMLIIVFSTFLVSSLLLAFQTKEDKYILLTALVMISYHWWYFQSYSLQLAFVGLVALYIFYLFYKKQEHKYFIILFSFMLLSLLSFALWIKLLLVFTLFIALKAKLFERTYLYLLGASILAFFMMGGFAPVINRLEGYLSHANEKTTMDGFVLHFYAVIQTIREASSIPFETFANRISGHSVTFILAVAGYLWLSYRHRVVLLALPLVGLGFFAYFGGLRFTIYAVPAMALGIGYLIYNLASLTNTKFKQYFFMSLLTFAALLPNIFHIVDYKVPTVFMNSEVETLAKLKNIADREDYVVAWWDYGYPIRYYADVKTLIDGGKHLGSDNFATSFALTQPQGLSAVMSRLDVEYTEAKYLLEKDDIDRNRTNIASMMVDNGFTDSNDFLDALPTLELPEKTRDIYLFLPNRMFQIYPTLIYFSNLDLMNGAQKAQPFFHFTNRFEENEQYLHLGYYMQKEIIFNKTTGNIEIDKGRTTLGLKSITQTYYDTNENLQVAQNDVHFDGTLYMIYMKSYNQFLVVDESVYNSTFFQLFVLENHDSNYYEPAILSPQIKIYKLKV
ncbi:MAG: STT3 domain-containing protein [Sulfurimonadaceae bacterium]|jgi:dolichyl-diphosphooligosaccharide--protein glycosyltransferase/undecaprenyl-diphosphooligosaccharide--protein glycosyltransferase|nr:STT3 domain-containing protein [Sulfurimonadaceae bacterium]